ncbi:hypothetical protein [Haliangium sp.]|uniref:hypothetical protein n=1 Tax=Haliangium sp. TaxID=2663208 RepID=UPI003D09EA2F
MDIQQLSIKVLATSNGFDQEDLIPIFHRWIRERRLGDDLLLIDVADYRHVVDGPGIMLIANEAHYGLDHGGGQLGLLYSRKRDPAGDAGARLREGFTHALTACDALAREPTLAGRLGFELGRLEVRIMSRLVAPNSAETYDRFQPILRGFLADLYDSSEIACEHIADPRRPFTIRVEIAGEHDPAALLARLRA